MKKLNRTGLIVIIMALFSLMACLPAYAANETAAIHPSTSSASTGDVITFTVSISNVTSARGIAVIPTYDTNTFDLVSGEWLISGSLSDFSVASGDGVIALDKASDFDSAILTFSLKVKDSAPLGNATVGCAVVVSNSSGSNIPLDASDSVEIVCRHFELPLRPRGGIFFARNSSGMNSRKMTVLVTSRPKRTGGQNRNITT